MIEIVLQLHVDRRDLLVPEQLHTEYDSPLCRSEVLHQRMTDAQLYPQISSCPTVLQTSG